MLRKKQQIVIMKKTIISYQIHLIVEVQINQQAIITHQVAIRQIAQVQLISHQVAIHQANLQVELVPLINHQAVEDLHQISLRGGNTEKPSSGGSTSKPSDNDDKEEEKPHTHIFTSNTGKWFDTQEECVAYYDKEVARWEAMLSSGEKTYEEFCKGCPMGYEVYRCTCGKRTISFSYSS